MGTTIATTRITLIDTIRRTGFWIGALSFLLVGVSSAIPFSPGIPQEAAHYMEAGLSALLLGGFFISLLILPQLVPGGRVERMLALPLNRWRYVCGLYAGFGVALISYFLVGGFLLVLVAEANPEYAGLQGPLPKVVWACFLSFVMAALVLLTSRYLSFVPAITLAVLIMILGQATSVLPFPLYLFVPAFGPMDPLTMEDKTFWEAIWVVIHGSATIALYLCLAGWERKGG